MEETSGRATEEESPPPGIRMYTDFGKERQRVQL